MTEIITLNTTKNEKEISGTPDSVKKSDLEMPSAAPIAADKTTSRSSTATSTVPTDRGFTMAPISALRPHPLNEKIYGKETADTEFVESVRERGIYAPLLATADGKIISGHRRYAAAVEIGLSELPVVYRSFSDELAEREALIDANRQRVKSHVQIAREYRERKAIEQERAKQRQTTNTGGTEGRKIFTPAEKGKSRDKAAEAFDKSGVSLEKAAAVIEQIDNLRAKDKSTLAAELETELNRSIDAGHRKAKSLGLIKSKVSSKASKGTKAASAKDQQTAASASAAQTASIPPASSIQTADKSENDLAMEHADWLVTYVRKKKAKSLTDTQRRDWTRALGPIVKWFKTLA